MEVKLRRKGEVIVVGGFLKSDLPDNIRELLVEGKDGIDFTKYGVISVFGGKFAKQQVEKFVQERDSGRLKVPVVYRYCTKLSFCDSCGILLPQHFNVNNIQFYATEAQLRKLEEQESQKRHRDFLDEVTREFPEYYQTGRWNFGDSTRIELYPKYLSDNSITIERCSYLLAAGSTIEQLYEEINKKKNRWEVVKKIISEIRLTPGFEELPIVNIKGSDCGRLLIVLFTDSVWNSTIKKYKIFKHTESGEFIETSERAVLHGLAILC